MLYSMATPYLSERTYSLRLTKDQKSYIARFLPQGYSFQSHPQHHQTKPPALKSSTTKNFQILKEESVQEKGDLSELKRRKAKTLKEPEVLEKRSAFGKKDEINKRAHIVKKLKKHEASWPFRTPVNPKTLDIPNYFQVVLTPMDLHTIEQKIKEDNYEHPGEIERDIAQIFLNSYKFNPKNDTYFQATIKLEAYYHDLLNQIKQVGNKKQLPDRQKKKEQASHQSGSIADIQIGGTEKVSEFNQIQKQLNSLLKKTGEFCNTQKVGRQKPSYFSTKNDYNITLKEKKQLAEEIKKLDGMHLQRVFMIIKSSNAGHNPHTITSTKSLTLSSPNLLDQNKNEAEVASQEYFAADLQKLDQKTLRELNNYIKLQKSHTHSDRDLSIEDSREARLYANQFV